MFKIASYLDEAGEDPIISCETLKKYDISYVVLRNSWGDKNICDNSDQSCNKLRTLLNDNNISVISICSNLGKVPSNKLMDISDGEINRVFDIASYFGAESIRIFIGTKVNDDTSSTISEWMSKITDICIKSRIIPILEITNDAQIVEPSGVANLLYKHKKWKILYDPVQIIIKRKIDPFVKYWSLLKNNVAAIDVRDCIVGRGFKSPGFGDCNLKQTLEDAQSSNFSGWLFLEPNLGRRYGSANTKSETFSLAMDGLECLIGSDYRELD